MRVRNKILALILAAAMPFTFTACGSDDKGSKTAQQESMATDKDSVIDKDSASDEKSAADLLADAQEKINGVKSMSAVMNMEMDMDVEANGEKQSMQTVTDMNMVYFKDPLKLKAEMKMDMGEAGSTSAQIYAEMDDEGKYTMYMGDGTNWQAQSVQLTDLEQYDAASNMNNYLDESYNFEMAGTEQVNGKDAYKLEGKITGDDMKEAMLSSGALDSLSSLNVDSAQLESMLDGLGDIPITMWIDKESGYPSQYDMDMSDVMSSLMSKIVESMGEQTEGFSMNVSKMKIKMTCSDYDAAEDFEIPKKAKKAKKA